MFHFLFSWSFSLTRKGFEYQQSQISNLFQHRRAGAPQWWCQRCCWTELMSLSVYSLNLNELSSTNKKLLTLLYERPTLYSVNSIRTNSLLATSSKFTGVNFYRKALNYNIRNKTNISLLYFKSWIKVYGQKSVSKNYGSRFSLIK